MTIYVDPLFTATARTAQARRLGNRWCHLVTDSSDLEELHAFAARLGLVRAWFQPHATLPHYDLTPAKRALAVRLGAVEVDGKTLALLNFEAHRPLQPRAEGGPDARTGGTGACIYCRGPLVPGEARGNVCQHCWFDVVVRRSHPRAADDLLRKHYPDVAAVARPPQADLWSATPSSPPAEPGGRAEQSKAEEQAR